VLKKLFQLKETSLKQAGRISLYLQEWEKITQNPIILETVKGWKIPFLKQPIQKQLPKAISHNQNTIEQVATEIKPKEQ